ncbi:MAG: NAD-dependent epimerase/dehydratase family protein [Deltaproteobacteria bacterium]|nr:NAD-dependent epimerase/dehydratase family protein [Deltaproteobacteria bacterium]
MSTPLHVILGAGQIGPSIASSLLEKGLRVRLVRRGPFTVAPAGVETRSADLSDPAEAARAMAGAEVVYNTVTPPYAEWGTLLLPLHRGILAGATETGAHLVVLDNLYVYGRAPDGRMTETTPAAPCSKKGELRAQAAAELVAARERGDCVVTIGRASDFFGPGATLASIFGDRFWQRVLSGKSGECFGDPDAAHSYSYLPDVVRGMVVLGTDPRAKNRTWHLPVNKPEATRATVARMGEALGRPIKTTAVPRLVLSVMGLFQPIVREIAEMTYQWDGPFILDDSHFTTTFGERATDWASAARASVAWARSHYG